jgi:hypothetical protein
MDMDANSFDRLARRMVARTRSRRSIARIAGVGVAGAFLGRRVAAPAATACVALGKRCRRGDRCCDGRCQDGRCRCQKDGDCRGGRFCDHGKCVDKRDFDEPCAGDHECRSGICDRYSETGESIRFACNPDGGAGQCRDGSCCPDDNVEPTGGFCSYQNATPDEFCVVCGGCAGTLCCPPALCQDGGCCCRSGTPNCDPMLPTCAA